MSESAQNTSTVPSRSLCSDHSERASRSSLRSAHTISTSNASGSVTPCSIASISLSKNNASALCPVHRHHRQNRHERRPPSSTAGSIFTHHSYSTISSSDASTALTYPSPRSSKTELNSRRALNGRAYLASDVHSQEQLTSAPASLKHVNLDADAIQSGGWTQEAVDFTDDDVSSWALESSCDCPCSAVVVSPRSSSLPANQEHPTPLRNVGTSKSALASMPSMQAIQEQGTAEQASTRAAKTSPSPGLIAGLRKKLMSRKSSDLPREDVDMGRHPDGRTGVNVFDHHTTPSLNDQVTRLYLGSEVAKRQRALSRSSRKSLSHERANMSPRSMSSTSDAPSSELQEMLSDTRADSRDGKTDRLTRHSSLLQKGSQDGLMGRLLRPASRLPSLYSGENKSTGHIQSKPFSSNLQHRNDQVPGPEHATTSLSRASTSALDQVHDSGADGSSIFPSRSPIDTSIYTPRRPNRDTEKLQNTQTVNGIGIPSYSRSTLESSFNLAHDKRWSSLGPTYASQLERRSSTHSSISHPYAMGRRQSNASSLGPFSGNRPRRESKASMLSAKTGTESSHGLIDQSSTCHHSGMDHDTVDLHRIDASSTHDHTGQVEAEGGQNLISRLSRGRGSTPNLGGIFTRSRKHSIAGSLISRPQLPLDLDKPLPLPPEDDQQCDHENVESKNSNISTEDISSPQFVKSDETQAASSSATLTIPPTGTSLTPQWHIGSSALQSSLNEKFFGRQTRSFSDLLAYEQLLDGKRAMSRSNSTVQDQTSGSNSSIKRPTFGLDLQPDAAAAFDSIPLPDTPNRTRSRASSLRPEDSIWLDSRRSSKAESSRASADVNRVVDVPVTFDEMRDDDDEDDPDGLGDLFLDAHASGAHDDNEEPTATPTAKPLMAFPGSPSTLGDEFDYSVSSENQRKDDPESSFLPFGRETNGVQRRLEDLWGAGAAAVTVDQLRVDGFTPPVPRTITTALEPSQEPVSTIHNYKPAVARHLHRPSSSLSYV